LENQNLNKTLEILKMELMSIFTILGFLFAHFYFLKFSKFLFHLIFKKKIDLKDKYYQTDSWAIITGASDGIGKEFAKKLASFGFNVCLMARNKEKTEAVASEIKHLSPNIQVASIICDFRFSETDDFHLKISSELSKFKDIAILINNVGMGLNGFFIESPWEEMRDMINVNCMSFVLLTKLLSPHFLSRGKTSLIINLSSYTRVNPTPFCSIYGATKSFDDYFSRVLDYELSEKIDILSFSPLFVSTNMTGFRKDFGAISSKEAVEGVMGEIGYKNQTYGHWKHQIMGFLLGCVLGWEGVVKWVIRKEWVQKMVKKEFYKARNAGKAFEKEEKKD